MRFSEQYENLRASQEAISTVEADDHRKRTLINKRSSIYVDAFNLALETVLDDESHLFDEPEMVIFENWRKLDYESQYL